MSLIEGTVQDDFDSFFFMYGKAYYEPPLVLTFFRGPTILDQRRLSSLISGETLSEIYMGCSDWL
jgi:hypothetical protein